VTSREAQDGAADSCARVGTHCQDALGQPASAEPGKVVDRPRGDELNGVVQALDRQVRVLAVALAEPGNRQQDRAQAVRILPIDLPPKEAGALVGITLTDGDRHLVVPEPEIL